MMNKKLTQALILFTTITSTVSFAEVIHYNPASTTDPSTGYELDVSGTEAVSGKNLTLTQVGNGIRTENVGIMGNQKIYLAQFFAQNPSAIVRNSNEVSSSLTAAGMKAIKLTFNLIAIPVANIKSAFSTSLSFNISNDEEQTYGADRDLFLSQVSSGSGFRKKQSITLLGFVRDDGIEEVIYEDTSQNKHTVDSKAAGFVNKIFSIWLGNINPKDDGLLSLKNQLLIDPKLTAK